MITLNSIFKDYDLDYILIPRLESPSPSFFHILDVSGQFNYSYLLLSKNSNDKLLFCSSLSKPDAIHNNIPYQEGKLVDILTHICNSSNNNDKITLGVDSEFISYKTILEIQSYFEKISLDLKIKSIPLENLREVKTSSKLKSIKKASEIVSIVADKIPTLVYDNISESELKSLIEYEMNKLGGTKLSFDTIVLFGMRSALPHGVPCPDIKLKKGDFILCDFGATINNYVSDLTRTFIYKPDISSSKFKIQKQVYNLVLKYQKKAIEKYIPLTNLSKLNTTIVKSLNDSTTKLNLDFKMIHSLGHGFGLEVHELPFFRNTPNNIFKKNQTVTCEPGLYDQNIGGVRIEDDIQITDDKPNILTTAKKELNEIIIN